MKIVRNKIRNKTLADVLKVLSGNAVAQAMGFFALAIVAREIGPIKFGQLSVFIATLNITTQITDFGFSTTIVKHGSDLVKSGSNYKNYIFTVLLFRVAVSLVLMAIFFIYSNEFSQIIFGTQEKKHFIEAIGISMPLGSIFFTALSHQQAIQNFTQYSVLNIATQIFRLITLILILILSSVPSVLMLSYGYLAPLIVLPILIIFTNIRRRSNLNFDFKELFNSMKVGIWAFLSALLSVAIMRLDVLIMENLSTSLEVGYYSAATQLAMVFPLVTSAVVATLLPRATSFISTNSIEAYRRKIFSSAKYILAAIVLAVLFSPVVVKLAFGVKYHETVKTLQILLLAYGIGALVNPLVLIFYAIRKPYILTIVLLFQLMVNFFLSVSFVPEHHALGAAVAALIARVMGLIVFLCIINFFERREKGMERICLG